MDIHLYDTHVDNVEAPFGVAYPQGSAGLEVIGGYYTYDLAAQDAGEHVDLGDGPAYVVRVRIERVEN